MGNPRLTHQLLRVTPGGLPTNPQSKPCRAISGAVHLWFEPLAPPVRIERYMASSDIFTLGRGLTPPWRVIDQRLETDKQPHELHLAVAAEPGARFPCPTCGRLCKPHDWKKLSWRHLNFFQHTCIIPSRVPRTDCPDHGVLRINVPWARPGSGFTLLFELVALLLMREMPVSAAARQQFSFWQDRRFGGSRSAKLTVRGLSGQGR